VRTAIVLAAAVLAALGGGYAIAANAPTPRQVVSPPAAPSDFVGTTPVRVLDTRGAAGGPIGVPAAAKLAAGQSIDVAVAGVGAIPKDAISVAVNITIDEDATLKSFLTVWPTGEARPNTSANNAEPGLVSPNSAIFQLGTDGKLSVFNQQGTVNVIMDVTGYFVAAGAGGTTTTTTTAPGGTTTTTTPSGPTAALDTNRATYPSTGTVFVLGTGWSGCTNLTVTLEPDAVVVITNFSPLNNGSFVFSFPASAGAVGTGKTLVGTGTGTGCTATSSAFDITA